MSERDAGDECEIKFNITLKELEAAAEFAKTHGILEYKSITMEIGTFRGIGNTIKVISRIDGRHKDISDYDCW